MEYLYDQTGQVLQVIQGDATETDDIGGDANDEDSDDEGFDEALAFNDPTITPPQFIIDQPARQSTTIPRQHSRHLLCPFTSKNTRQ